MLGEPPSNIELTERGAEAPREASLALTHTEILERWGPDAKSAPLPHANRPAVVCLPFRLAVSADSSGNRHQVDHVALDICLEKSSADDSLVVTHAVSIKLH